MFFNKKLTKLAVIPRHVAFIMDGNGRWARKRGLPREVGHAAGAEVFRRVIDDCEEAGVEYITTYAFSTENWSRPEKEVKAIMDLLDKYLDEIIEKLAARNAIVRFLGDKSRFTAEKQAKMIDIESRPTEGKRLHLNIALNYGSRDEIVRAFNKLRLEGREITEKDISNELFTYGQPDPDLIVRTGGDIRTSNFLLWQASYSEFYFTPVLWPDFSRAELYKAFDDYSGRQRRYGKVPDSPGNTVKKFI